MFEILSLKATSHALHLSRQQAFDQAARMKRSVNLTTFKLDLSKTKDSALDNELSRRKFALLIYFLRAPLFDRTTLPMLNYIKRIMQYIPLIHSLPDYLKDILVYFNHSYFRTASSS